MTGPPPTVPPDSLPHNLDAEQAVLGAILQSNSAFWHVSDILEARHFFEPVHARIFAVLGEFVAIGKLADAVTVSQELADDVALTELRGARYLRVLQSAAMAVISVTDYAVIVRDLAVRRDLINLARDIVDGVRSSAVSAPELLATTQSALDRMNGAERSDEPIRPISYFAERAYAEAEEIAISGRSPGTTFGLGHLDVLTGGMVKEDLIVLAARPGMGKSTLLAHTALAACANGEPPLFYSFEMRGESMALRMMSALSYRAGMPFAYSDALKGKLSPIERQYLRDARDALIALPIDLRVKRSLTVSQIKLDARRHMRALEKRGMRMGPIIIDYLGLLRPEATYRGRRVEEVTEISADLKTLAGELGGAVLVAAQLNREVEKRADKKPMLSDLRESGALEQDADKVILPFRAEYYVQKDEPDDRDIDAMTEWRNVMANVRGAFEVIVAKNRMGPEGVVKAWCDVSFNAIRDTAPHNQ